jgi:hypothetical protein
MSPTTGQSFVTRHNVRGQRVSTLNFGLGELACWDTTKIAPGLYIARAKVGYGDGSTQPF